MNKTALLSYSLRYKYLNSFIKTGYITFSCYYFNTEDLRGPSKNQINSPEFQIREIKIPSKYLKLLVNRKSKVR